MKEREIKFGDIYWLELQHPTGHQFSKKRPYLIIDSDVYLANSKLACTVPFTSNLKNRNIFDIIINADYENRLKSNSIAKLDHIYTFDKTQFVNYIGKVGKDVIKLIQTNLIKHFI